MNINRKRLILIAFSIYIGADCDRVLFTLPIWANKYELGKFSTLKFIQLEAQENQLESPLNVSFLPCAKYIFGLHNPSAFFWAIKHRFGGGRLRADHKVSKFYGTQPGNRIVRHLNISECPLFQPYEDSHFFRDEWNYHCH